MSPKGKIIKCGETILFDMPALGKLRAHGNSGRDGGDDLLYARQRAEMIEREAYEAGFSSGEKTGLELGERKAAVLLERLGTVIAEMYELRDSVLRELEPQITGLAAAIARKIVLEELTVRPELIVNIVKEAMRKLERTGTITIKISPSLHDLFIRMKPELMELYPEIVYDVDPSASATGPLVVGAREEVVTDIDDQLKNIVECIGSHDVAH